MAEPHVEQLTQTLRRLDTVTAREAARGGDAPSVPPRVDDVLLSHVMTGLQASTRALAVPPAADAPAHGAWAIRELRAAIALLEEWAE